MEKDASTADGLDPKILAEMLSRIPVSRLGKPEDVAGMIAFLLSEDASYITGQVIHVNGGL
ncbi:SDR family oxidoreductase [Pseudosulfitobacter sp. SM2401]|uniref:SDR family oxidoreductase n=1 Tax=Pseudosulfitobacter sp. SM2401 TaxID=3350098 RepID=UPI0036F25B13